MTAAIQPPNEKNKHLTTYQKQLISRLVKEIEQAEWSGFDFRGSKFYQAVLADHLRLLSEERGITRRQILAQINLT